MAATKLDDPFIRFSSEFKQSLLYGRKCITVRPEDECEVYEGQVVNLVDEDGDVFGTAVVDSKRRMRVDDFVSYRLDGHETYDSVAHFNESMQEYYPDRSFDRSDLVDVFWLRGFVDEET